METMGQKFRAAREKKRIPISRAAALTHVKVQHLEMMENDDFTKMPAPTYAKGFIRIYSGFLGLDPAPLIQEYIDVHLNAAEADEKPAPRARHAEAASPSEPRGKDSVGDFMRKASAALRSRLASLGPQLPRIGLAAVAVLLVVGMVRCAVRLGSGNGKDAPEPVLLDSHAIMKEPPVRYLDLPSTGAEQP